MKKPTFITKALLTLAVVALGTFGLAAKSHAIVYDPNNPVPTSTTPAFNVFTNVPNYIGDESDFVRLRNSNGDPTVPANQNNFVDPLNSACAIGSKFDIRTYSHNGADPSRNNNGSGTAVAHNVNVAMTAPLGVTGKNFTFRSTISASNATSVTDNGTLNCATNVRLKLVPQTVKVYSNHTGWVNAPDSSVNGNLKIGSRVAGSGDQWACWDDRMVVVYTVEVIAVPPAPVYTCDALTVSRIGDLKKERKYSFAIRYTANNGATLKSVKYNFGDNTNQTVAAAPFSTQHAYAKDGEYKVTTDLVFTVNGEEKTVTDAKCAATIKTSVEEPCPTKPSVPKDSPECTVCPYNPNLPKDSPDCKQPPVTTIPSTGIGGIVTGLLGSSVASYGAYAYLESKKSLAKLIGRK